MWPTWGPTKAERGFVQETGPRLNPAVKPDVMPHVKLPLYPPQFHHPGARWCGTLFFDDRPRRSPRVNTDWQSHKDRGRSPAGPTVTLRPPDASTDAQASCAKDQRPKIGDL